MFWVVVMAVIALLGVLMLVGYARWLWHKASDLMSEVAVVTDRLGELGTLLGQLQPFPDSPGRPVDLPVHTGVGDHDGVDHDGVDHGDTDEDDEDDDWAEDARDLRLRMGETRVAPAAPAARHARRPDHSTSDRGVGDVS